MIFGGNKFRSAPYLEWRNSKPSTDLYICGEPVPEGYAIIYSRKTGKLRPLWSHGLKYLAFGAERKNGSCTAYLVHDGRVYTAPLKWSVSVAKEVVELIYDGRKFRRAQHLGWRDSKPSDLYLYADGEPIPEGYVTIYSRKTGKLRPLWTHGLTNLAYGAERKDGSYTMYLVHDGHVYTAPSKRSGSVKSEYQIKVCIELLCNGKVVSRGEQKYPVDPKEEDFSRIPMLTLVLEALEI